MIPQYFSTPPNGRASMGPRLFRRGNLGRNTISCMQTVASMGPRLFRRGNNVMDWVKDTANEASMGPRLFRRGNDMQELKLTKIHNASMGPRLFRRGNCRGNNRKKKPRRCFNGATSFQTWKCPASASRSTPSPCFNGATSFQTWKSSFVISKASILTTASMGPRLFRRGNDGTEQVLTIALKLQWGHVFSDVEKSQPSGQGCRQRVASMGPRLFRRGNVPNILEVPSALEGFNGATSFQTWKYIQACRHKNINHGASMGPRLFRRGNGKDTTRISASSRMLQWGHVFSDVEISAAISLTPKSFCFNGATSFQTWK